jgi:hypothetical protein
MAIALMRYMLRLTLQQLLLVIMINQLPSNQFSDATLWIVETILGLLVFDI